MSSAKPWATKPRAAKMHRRLETGEPLGRPQTSPRGPRHSLAGGRHVVKVRNGRGLALHRQTQKQNPLERRFDFPEGLFDVERM